MPKTEAARRNMLAALCFWPMSCPPDPTPMAVALQKMNLVEMRQPKQVWPIGTVVALRRNGQGAIIEVVDLCDPSFIDPSLVQLGRSFQKDRTAEVADLEKRSAQGSISMTGVVLEDVKATLGADARYVQGMTLTISNAWILYADAVTLAGTAQRLMQNPDCARQVDNYRKSGFEINSLSRVFVADLVYNVTFSAGAEPHLRLRLLERMSAQLSVRFDAERSSLVRGSALTFGFAVPPVSPVP
ncbi:hypothetical protein ACFQX4_21025 [Roseomonas sp. GCM10028921]